MHLLIEAEESLPQSTASKINLGENPDMRVLEALQPNRVFYYFEKISEIPRGSYHTKAVSDYCVSIAKELGLAVRQDDWNNVVIRKPASKGCEHSPVFMIQGHLDMVCEKEPDCTHDFDTEGLELLVDGDYITANGTTLGGDDGIAIAMALAILEDDTLVHPPLEVVFTTEEEVGMDGAIHLDTTDLHAQYLLNLDSEDEGVLTVGCAGGSTQELHKPISRETVTGIPYQIRVHGLQGGHSGVEIQKGRINSNKVMSTILCELMHKTSVRIADIHGGFKHNAIPRESEAMVLFMPGADLAQAESVIKQVQQLYAQAYRDSDSDIAIDFQPCGVEYKVKNGHLTKLAVFSEEQQKELLQLLVTMPTGVQAMSQTIPGLPETSTNLAVLQLRENEIYLEISNRSSQPAALTLLENRIAEIAGYSGFSIQLQSRYPGWKYRTESLLRDSMKKLYRDLFQKDAVVEMIHAGLECGILLEKMPELDIVSTGPDILDIHTPQERMSISSVARTWTYVLEILKYFAFL